MVTILCLLTPAFAGALECAAPPGADVRLVSIPAEQRIAWIRERLQAVTPAARRWSWTWGATNGALAAGQLAAIPFTSSSGSRWVLGAGAATSALAVVQVTVMPIVPAPVHGEGCAELGGLEASLERSAQNAALASGTAAQVGNVAVNAALAVAAGLVDHHWTSGATSFAIGWTLGEAQILTVPTALVRDLERYRAGALEPAAAAPSPPRIGASLRVGRRGAVAALVARF
jgi:hypothetical protein